MEYKVSDLVKRGHDKAAQLKSSGGSVSQLISDLATQLDVQLARSNALAVENAGLKNALEWLYEAVSMPDSGPIPDKYYSAVTNAAAVMHETPATDAFLAEVRAQGVEAAIATAKNVVAQEFHYKDFETAQRDCSKFPESDLVGKVEMVEWLQDFAAEIRKGVRA